MVKNRICTLLACALLLGAAPASVDANRKKPYIVMSNRNVNLQQLTDLLNSYGAPVSRVIQQSSQPSAGATSAVVVDLDPATAQQVLSSSTVAAVAENTAVSIVPVGSASTAGSGISIQTSISPTSLTGPWASYASETFGDSTYAPWNLDRINQHMLPLDGRSDVSGDGGSNVDVYVVDTGVSTDFLPSDEFDSRVTSFWSPPGTTAGDDHGHGTFVAGIIGGKTYGVAKKAQIKSVKVFDSTGSGDTATLMQGLSAILFNRNRDRRAIVSMSLTGDGRSSIIEWFVAALLADNVLVVTAAGNAGYNMTAAAEACSFSPGASASSLTVGATDQADKMVWWSNFGSCVKILAPGQDVYSIWRNGSHMALSGTSMAAPHVSGAAALLWSMQPAMSSKQVFRAILQTASDNSMVTSSLPVGTPPLLVYADFTIFTAPSEDDIKALPGVTLTPCGSTNCPANVQLLPSVQFANGARRVVRGTDAAFVNHVFVSTDGGASYSAASINARRLIDGGLSFDWVLRRWACQNNGFYLGSLWSGVGVAYFCQDGRVLLMHDFVGPVYNEIFFRLEPDPAWPLYNYTKVSTYGWTGTNLQLLTDIQTPWIYAWRGGVYTPGPDGRLTYGGQDWVYSPARRWYSRMFPLQFDYVINEARYANYPVLYWGGGLTDVSYFRWRSSGRLATVWAQYSSSYTSVSYRFWRSGFSDSTWTATLQAYPDILSGKSAISAFFWNGADLFYQTSGVSGKLAADGTLGTYGPGSTGTVVDVSTAAAASTFQLSFSSAGWSGTDSIFYAPSSLFTSPGYVEGGDWDTSSGAEVSWMGWRSSWRAWRGR